MSKGSDWFGGHKPVPPFPEKVNRRKARRDRVKIPKNIPSDYPVLSREEYYKTIPQTSTAKGIGRKTCVELMEHDWVGMEPGWFPGKKFRLIACTRCGETGVDGDIW